MNGGRPLACKKVVDAITDKVVGTIGDDHRVELRLEPLSGKTLIVVDTP